MALIHVYNGIKERSLYNFTGRIRDNININWKNAVIIKGGYRITPDYEVQPNDIIYIRKTPAAATALTTAAIIAGSVGLLAGGIAVGVSIYNNKKAQSAYEDAQKKAKALSDNIEQLPNIKGARNQIATGRGFPVTIGRSLMTPYFLTSPHYTIEGEHGESQYYHAVLQLGYNNLVLDKIKIGETVVKQFSGNTPQNGVYNFDDGLFFDEENEIEIRQSAAFSNDEYNKKIIYTELNAEIPHEHLPKGASAEEVQRITEEWQAGVVQELPNHTKAVEIFILFDGLRKLDNDGDWSKQSVTLRPQWTNANNPTENDWVDFTTPFIQNGVQNNVFNYNTNNQMRFKARQEFTAAEAYNKTIKIRVQRTTPKAESGARENVYIWCVQSEIYDAKTSSSTQLNDAQILSADKREQCARMGIKIKANINTKNQLDAISVMQTACARTWNGTAWSTTKTPTRNLAAWVFEILTSPIHSASRYDDDEIDIESFGEWYEYCEQQGFNADGVIINGQPKFRLINTLLANGNAALVYNKMTGLMEIAIDNGRDYSVALLNSENIINITTTKELKRKTDGRKVTYINGAADYEVDTVKFMRDGGEYDPETDTLQELALDYVTDYNHAYKIAWRNMAEETAQPRTVTVKTGYESAYYPLFSRVELQHKSLKIGIANAVIKELIYNNSYLKQIKIDGTVTFPATGACGILIHTVSNNGRGLLALKVDGTGKTDTLEVLTTYRRNQTTEPLKGNILSFGLLDNDGQFSEITSSMKIINTEETDGGYNLTLVDYNPAIYSYGEIPTYKSNITSAPAKPAKTIEDQREYIAPADLIANASGAAQAAVDTVIKGTRFTNIYKIRQTDTSLEDIIKKIDDDARNTSASISISSDEILLQVNDMERELTGLISVQAGAVTALVEGGGASGQMSLSLNLPILINAEKRAQFIGISTEAKVNAVYAQIENSTNYGIKPNASNAEIKALWDDAVAGGLLASQIELQADQIYIDGDVILNNERKIKAALIDVENIFVQEIEIKQNGVLKSSNYIENQQGFKLTDTELESMSGKFNGSIQNGIIDATGGLLIPFSYNGTISQATPYLILTSEWTNVTAAENPYGTGATRRRSYKTDYYDVNKRYLGYQVTAYYEYDINNIGQEIQLDAYTKAVTKVTNININGYTGDILGEFKLHNIPDERKGDSISGLDHDEIYVDNNGFLKRVN